MNPFRRIVLAYCEGELQVTRCDDDRELAAELHRIADWHREHDRWKGIDPWNNALARRLDDAGAGDLVHLGPKAAGATPSTRRATFGGQVMPDGTTSVSGPTAALGAHLELDLALDNLLGSRVRTFIRAGETSRQAERPPTSTTHWRQLPATRPSDHRCANLPRTSPDSSRTPCAVTQRQAGSP